MTRDESRDARDERQPPLMGTLLRIPFSMIGEAVEQGLIRAGHEGITRSHLTVVQPLSMRPEGARMTDLAAWAHIAKPSMAYLVRHLEERGYVERTADPTDGRAQQVRLTSRSRAAAQTVRDIVRETENAWAARIGRDELEELRRLLTKLAAATRPDDGAPW